MIIYLSFLNFDMKKDNSLTYYRKGKQRPPADILITSVSDPFWLHIRVVGAK